MTPFVGEEIGAFSRWQPLYAERGISTFPVHIDEAGKRPAVKGYLTLGSAQSRRLVRQFSKARALGFVLGKRSGVTVLDIDTSDERIVAEAFDRHGQTPIVVRSGSGNFQGWYRHAGESRLIRPTAAPIDILGGGFIVAPPSVGKLRDYQFVQGGLDDLGSLPVLRNAPAVAARAENSFPSESPHGVGERNIGLFRLCMVGARACDDLESLEDYATTQNAQFKYPLDEKEVRNVVRSAWGYEERGLNFLGIGRTVYVSHLELENLMSKSGDALMLLLLLRKHHWNRDFAVANVMAETMPGGPWARKRLARARSVLEQEGKIELVKAAGRGTGPSTYRWPKRVVEINHQ
jgi:Bifunctional DNA primase/polymerase, N-terminal/Primase C terminal 1 (PriCT-1)